MVLETKLHESFPIGQLIIEGLDLFYRENQRTNDG